MKITKYLAIAGLSLGLNVGNAMALSPADIKKVKTEYVPVARPILEGIFKAGMSEDTAKSVVALLVMGVDIADFGFSLGDNIAGLQNTLGVAKTAFLNALGGTKADGTHVEGTIRTIIKQLKDPATSAANKELLAAQLNTQIIILLDNFKDFVNQAGTQLFIPLMTFVEAIPGVKDKMKFKSGAKFSEYTKDNINAFVEAVEIEKKLAPKLEALVGQAVEVKEAAKEAGTPIATPAAPQSFDDL